MSDLEKKYSKAKICLTSDRIFYTVDGKVLNSEEMEELRLYEENKKDQKEYEKIFGNPTKIKDVGLDGIPLFLSKWAKEVVRLLLKNGEMKHQDILLALKGVPISYNHISKIFKTSDAKEFFQSEIVNDRAYYSLRDPSQYKK